MRSGFPGLTRALLGVAEPPNALDPRGPAAADIASLWWVMFGLGALVFAIVVVLLAVASITRRDADPAADRWTGEGLVGGGNLVTVLGGVAGPAVIVLVLAGLMLTTGARVATIGNPSDPLQIEVTGHQFWWDVRYPRAGVRIANEVRLPAGEPVELVVTSDDVIHSLWIPNLGGKIDVTPGEVNTLRLQADEPGVYRGNCGEYCGVQHARMQFVAVALEPEAFDDWLEARAEAPDEPDDADALAGREIFLGAGCAECHTIEGVSPENDAYPDLTHFADRLTLGAGLRSNTRGNLGGWILDPQDLKPGSHMPPANLTGDELQRLLDYLETLE